MDDNDPEATPPAPSPSAVTTPEPPPESVTVELQPEPEPTPEPAPAPSVTASDQLAKMLERAVEAMERAEDRDAELRRLVQESLALQFKRLDQLAQIWETALREVTPVAQELRTTAEAMQQVISEADESSDRIAEATAALIKLYELMSAWLVQVKQQYQQAQTEAPAQ